MLSRNDSVKDDPVTEIEYCVRKYIFYRRNKSDSTVGRNGKAKGKDNDRRHRACRRCGKILSQRHEKYRKRNNGGGDPEINYKNIPVELGYQRHDHADQDHPLQFSGSFAAVCHDSFPLLINKEHTPAHVSAECVCLRQAAYFLPAKTHNIMIRYC